MPLPALRIVDATPIEHEGEVYVHLRDPLGFAQEQVLLSRPAFFIASLLDGQNDVLDVQYLFASKLGGQVLAAEDIQKVVDYLDGHGFLQTERFETLRQEKVAAFRGRPTRSSAMAGHAFPAEAAEARAYLDRFYTHDEGPGMRPGDSTDTKAPLCGLVAPHIDFDRGGPVYAHSYLRLAQGPPPDTVLVFGVAHAAPTVPYILTRKHFETPFGVVESDAECIARLETACSWDPYEEEFLHQGEHSIEFQAVMLASLYGTSVRIIPVLCGPLGSEEPEASDAEPPEIAAFLERCRELVSERHVRMLVLAGADLAHVGLRFGDRFDIDDAIIATVEARDREDLEYVAGLDAQGWRRSVVKDGNARRVCGLHCIYATLRTLQGVATQGELLGYGYAHDPQGGMVSFASLAIG